MIKKIKPNTFFISTNKVIESIDTNTRNQKIADIKYDILTVYSDIISYVNVWGEFHTIDDTTTIANINLIVVVMEVTDSTNADLRLLEDYCLQIFTQSQEN